MNGIIIQINQEGQLEGAVKSTDKKQVSVRKGELILSKTIIHTDRQPTKCTRKINISEDVAKEWAGGKAPFFIKDYLWKNMSQKQRIAAHVARFDEGFGTSFEIL